MEYVKRLEEMDTVLEGYKEKQREKEGSQDTGYEERIRQIEKLYKEVSVENAKLRHEHKRLEIKSEEMKEEIERSRNNAQLTMVTKQFEKSQEKINTLEKLCIQQRFEISELDDVVDRFRRSTLNHQQPMGSIISDNDKYKRELARLNDIETKLLQQGNEGECTEEHLEVQKLMGFYEGKLAEMSKAHAGLYKQITDREGKIKEYEKGFEIMLGEVKALQDLGLCDQSYSKLRRLAEKLKEEVKYSDAPGEGHGTGFVKKLTRSSKKNEGLTQDPEHDDENSELNTCENGTVTEEFRKSIASIESKVGWLTELCIECKDQNDYIKDKVESLLLGNGNKERINTSKSGDKQKRNEMVSSSHIGIVKDMFETLQRQIGKYQLAQKKEENSMQQEWSLLQQSYQKLIDDNKNLSQQIKRAQGDIATLKQVG